MNLRFDKLKKKVLISSSSVIVLLFLAAILIPSLRPLFLNTLRQPLKILTLIRREAGAVIFYHRNYVENERFKREIGLLSQKLNTQNELYLENERLKSLLSLKQESPYKVIVARVIARSSDSWSSSIIIDKGKYSGIKRGMAVISYSGLVGRVVETEESISKIMLINDPNLSISSLIQRSRQEGLVSGTLGSYLIMRYLPEEADIKVGDVIITSGLNQTYPKGLIIGTVLDVGKEFSGLSRYAIIKPAVNLSNIEEVLIIIQ